MVTLEVTQKTMKTSMELGSRKVKGFLSFVQLWTWHKGILFKKKASHIVTDESSQSKTQVDYRLVSSIIVWSGETKGSFWKM